MKIVYNTCGKGCGPLFFVCFASGKLKFVHKYGHLSGRLRFAAVTVGRLHDKILYYVKGVSNRDEPKETFAKHPRTSSQEHGCLRDRVDAGTG